MFSLSYNFFCSGIAEAIQEEIFLGPSSTLFRHVSRDYGLKGERWCHA